MDLEGGWVSFARVKTEIPRRVPLWAETIATLKEAIDARPKPKEARGRGLCFLTKSGRPWVRVKERARRREGDQRMPVPRDDLSPVFARLLGSLKINGRRGLGFYTLRHTFATVAGGAEDSQAVAAIMGHVDASMTGHSAQFNPGLTSWPWACASAFS